MIGKTIGQYRIVGQLGRGGMGSVYKAVDETLDREVAIKILNPELVDTEVMKRFRSEATILAKLNHPEIAAIYELFQSETDLLMVMEFVRGETLEKVADRLGALEPEQAAYLVDRILSALEHAHRAGIVHRDMKPANVMVTEHGAVKIMDFGIARVRGAAHVTLDGYMMGTPAYMPPEQVLGQSVDGRADLYSVGVVLYRLLTGGLPFNADTAIAVVLQQVSDPPTPLHVHREGLPDWCDPILQRALAKSPEDRFQTAEEFRAALGKAAGMVTTELTRTFALSLADGELTTPTKPSELERFGLTPVPRTHPQTQVLVVPNPAVSPTGSGAEAVGTLPPATSANSARNAEGAPIALRHKHEVLSRSTLAIVAGGLAVLAIAALRRPAVAPTATTASVPRAATGKPAVSRPHRPEAPLKTREGPEPRVNQTPQRREARLNSSLAAPFGFEARALVDNGDRWRERKSQVLLADGAINVQASDDLERLYAVPYEGVMSISYSRGRDPLWNAPDGPAVVARPSGLDLGIFRGERHWVSLRTSNAKSEFVVLRLTNDAQARRAITALEERTGRRAALVVERKDGG